MKLYFAGADCKKSYDDILISSRATCRLISFSSLSKKYTFNNKFDTYFLDSGAYSVSTVNAKINIDDYIGYIYNNLASYDIYATLDVIGDYNATIRNTNYMEKKGLNPLPVFHYNSPKEYLLQLIDKYDYIALGGLVPLAVKKKLLISWLDYCFSIIQYKKTKVHGFGINSKQILERYPFYSADSSSWLSMAKYGKSGFENKRTDKTINPLKTTEKEIEYWVNIEKYVTDLWAKKGLFTVQ